MPIQIILGILFALGIIKTIRRFRAHEISWQAMLMWLLLWAAGIVVVIEPNATFRIAWILGVQRGADIVVYAALTVIFFALFRLLVKVERLEKEITTLNRTLALRESSKVESK